MGIYSIRNIVTGDFYVGSSVDVNSRWDAHKMQLLDNCHANKKLQSSYNKHGSNSFVYQLVEETTDRESLLTLENKYIEQHWDSGKLYNFCRDATAPTRGLTLSEEHRRKIGAGVSAATKGRPSNIKGKTRSEEMKRRISETVKRKCATGEIRRVAWNKGVKKVNLIDSKNY